MRIFNLLVMLIMLTSCGKSDNNHQNDPNDDYQQILDGYLVQSIAFDEHGNAWIGTFKQGLIKYNSEETIVYNSNNSLISDTSVINVVNIDSKGNVWIGCEGLIKFDGNNFTHYNSSNSAIPIDLVSSIAIDSEDNVWFTSCRFQEGGIVKYNGSDWTVFTPENSPLPVNLVRSITIDNDDNVWLALSEIVENAYLTKISQNNWTIYTGEDLGFNPYYLSRIKTNSKNEVCGAIDYTLSSLLPHNGPQVFIFDEESSVQLQFDNITSVRSITIDKDDNIWCAGFGGYAVYDGQSWSQINSDFSEIGVSTIEQAADEKMWIGTWDGIFIKK